MIRLFALILAGLCAAMTLAIAQPRKSPPDSLLGFAGAFLRMTDSDIIALDRGPWTFVHAEDRYNLRSQAGMMIFMTPDAGSTSKHLCFGKGTGKYEGAECLSFDRLTLRRDDNQVQSINLSAEGFGLESQQELAEFIQELYRFMQKRLGAATQVYLSPSTITRKSLAKGAREGYTPIARWEWRDGVGRKAKLLRSAFIAVSKNSSSYSASVSFDDEERSPY